MTSSDLPASDSTSHAIAAVDLGSNSFHMIVAEDRQGQLVVLDRIKEMVRLAGGLDQDGNLSPEESELFRQLKDAGFEFTDPPTRI